jgi:chemotaxis protein MotB
MMSLLLCFFVLLLSFANMDIVKFREMMGSLKDAFGVKVQDPGELEERSSSPIELSESETKPIIELDPQPVRAREQTDRELLDQVEKFIDDRVLDGIVEAVPGQRGVTIRSDVLRPEATPILNEIAGLAARYTYKIAVQGHTDDVPIRTERFPSNWELSAARAVAGVRYLIEHGEVKPERVTATGLAHTQPITHNQTPAAKARNRRLEFVFYHEEDLLQRDGNVALEEHPSGPDLQRLPGAVHRAARSSAQGP